MIVIPLYIGVSSILLLLLYVCYSMWLTPPFDDLQTITGIEIFIYFIPIILINFNNGTIFTDKHYDTSHLHINFMIGNKYAF